jgi:hypothetical protein
MSKRFVVSASRRWLILMVSIAFAGQAGAQIGSSSGPAKLPHLKYTPGGHVVTNVKVQAVLWNAKMPFGVTAPDGGYAYPSLDDFYNSFLTGPAFTWLSEYSTTFDGGTQESIGPGTYLGSVAISPAVTTTTINDSQLVTELQRQIGLGTLASPSSDGDTMYVLHLSPGIIESDGPGQTTCNQYCGYHNASSQAGVRFLYAVIGDFGNGSGCAMPFACGVDPTPFNNMTSTISHEVAETVTDPDVGQQSREACGSTWCDPQPPDSASDHAEIGDICAALAIGSEGTFTDTKCMTHVVQRLWSNANNACITTLADAMTVQITPQSTFLGQVGSATYAVTTNLPTGSPRASLALSTLPSGLSGSFDSQLLAPGNTAMLTITGASTAPLDWTFAVAAIGGVTTNGNTLALGVAEFGFDNFTATANGGPITLNAGGTAMVTIATMLTQGTGPLPLSARLIEPPPGVTAQISPTTFNAGDTVTVTFSAAVGTPSGSPTLEVQFTGGPRSVTVGINSTISGDDFTATLTSSSVTLDRGKTATVGVTTVTSNGPAQPLTLTVSGLPTGVTGAFDSTSINSGATAHLTLTASSDAPLGPASFTVLVSGAESTVSLPGSLTIDAASGGCGCGAGTAGAAPGAAILGWLWSRRRRVITAQR